MSTVSRIVWESISPYNGTRIDEIPAEHASRIPYGSGSVRAVATREELLVLFKLGKYRLQLRKLFRSDTRKPDPKTMAVNPTHCRFVDPQRPIKAWNVESAFELRPLLHHHVAFNFTTADRNIQSSPLSFLPLTREGAAKLRGKSRLDSPVLWPRFGRSLIDGFELEERAEIFQRSMPRPKLPIWDDATNPPEL